MATTRRRLLALGVALTGGVPGCVGDARSDGTSFERSIPIERVTLHRGPERECCDRYVEYLERNGIDVSVRTASDAAALAETKRALDVPKSLWSCHTVEFGEHVIEGYVPLEAIERLFQTSGKIRGLAVPDVPQRGLEGKREGEEPIVVYAFRTSGDTTAFLEVE